MFSMRFVNSFLKASSSQIFQSIFKNFKFLAQTKWLKEMLGQKEILSAYGGVKYDDIRGMRAPFLAIGGNNMFAMLQEAKFTYDASMPIYDNKAEDMCAAQHVYF
jgi:hypothetical protein